MDKEEAIRQIVRDEFSKCLERLNLKQSSTELERTTAGKVKIKVKAYDEDVVGSVNKARAAYGFLLGKYVPEEDHDDELMPPLSAYEADAPAGAVDADYEDVSPGPAADRPADGFDGDEPEAVTDDDDNDGFE